MKEQRRCTGEQVAFRTPMLRVFTVFDNLFHQKACAEPVRGVVEPDNAVYIPRRAVVPGTAVFFGKQMSGCIFGTENAEHIDGAADKPVTVPKQHPDGAQQTGEPVNREHPEGCLSGQFLIASAERLKRRE